MDEPDDVVEDDPPPVTLSDMIPATSVLVPAMSSPLPNKDPRPAGAATAN